MKKSMLIIGLSLIFLNLHYGQTLYSIRGIVVDMITQEPLIGARLSIQSIPNIGASSSEDGTFEISNLSIGRHVLVANYIGYKDYLVPIEVKSGKELVLTVALSEDITQMAEVIISAQNDKSRAVNSMSYASTRTFSVEESNKFASAVDDPLRMVQSYAGVVGIEDGNNHISIRGNSPNGLLWRMEGIDIPNPNHYADPSSSGGGVSVLSSQMLMNSDFSTGAFSAEYGNALSGVFDLKLRKGNNKKREYTLKAGLLGLEGAIEGPFSKSYSGSYLINYRYSTLSLIDKIGIDLTGVLNYSDLAYNIHLPTKKVGTISLFGLHGVSSQVLDEAIDSLNINGNIDYTKGKFQSNMSVDGIKYFYSPSKKGFLNMAIAYTRSENLYDYENKIVQEPYKYFDKSRQISNNDKLSFSTNYTHKYASNIILRTGGMIDRIGYKIGYEKYLENGPLAENVAKENGQSNLMQGYSQLQWDANKEWTTHIGLHYTLFLLNNSSAIEPRLSLRHNINQRSNIALAYGIHSQVNTLPVYFIMAQNNQGTINNKELELAKAHHLVLTYQYDFNNYTRLRSEVYYQKLFDLAVGSGENKNMALLNHRYGFPDFIMTNDGIGKNIGIEATLERFMHNRFYFITTASLSDSKYKTKTSDWLNTRYNVGYTFVNTLGKEWQMGRDDQNTLSINLKSSMVGGMRYTPIDFTASQTEGREVLNNEEPFTLKVDDFFKLDVGLKYKRNHKGYTSTLALDVLNATNKKNVGGISYNGLKGKIETWYQAPLIPILSYKIEF